MTLIHSFSDGDYIYYSCYNESEVAQAALFCVLLFQIGVENMITTLDPGMKEVISKCYYVLHKINQISFALR